MSEKPRNAGFGPGAGRFGTGGTVTSGRPRNGVIRNGVTAAAPAARAEPVRLTIPADRDFVIMVRTVAARLGVRVGLSAAEIEDFRLAVDEACCLFLAGRTAGGATLVCEFTEFAEPTASTVSTASTASTASGGALTVTISGTVYDDFAREQVGTFGWTLLQSFVDGLWWSADRGRARVRLLKRHRAVPPPARRHSES